MSWRERFGLLCATILAIGLGVLCAAILWYLFVNDPTLGVFLVVAIVLIVGAFWGMS